MKKLTLLCLFAFGFSFGQYLQTQEEAEQQAAQENSHDFFQNEPAGPQEPEPDMGTEGDGNPGDPSPIDQWWLVLPVAGMGIAYYYLHQKRKTA